jgi:hypothetical protein
LDQLRDDAAVSKALHAAAGRSSQSKRSPLGRMSWAAQRRSKSSLSVRVRVRTSTRVEAGFALEKRVRMRRTSVQFGGDLWGVLRQREQEKESCDHNSSPRSQGLGTFFRGAVLSTPACRGSAGLAHHPRDRAGAGRGDRRYGSSAGRAVACADSTPPPFGWRRGFCAKPAAGTFLQRVSRDGEGPFLGPGFLKVAHGKVLRRRAFCRWEVSVAQDDK